jgi:hypothetical protein
VTLQALLKRPVLLWLIAFVCAGVALSKQPDRTPSSGIDRTNLAVIINTADPVSF